MKIEKISSASYVRGYDKERMCPSASVFQYYTISGVKPVNEWGDFDEKKVVRFVSKFLSHDASIIEVVEDREKTGYIRAVTDPIFVKVKVRYYAYV